MSAQAPEQILLRDANLICGPENTTYRTYRLAKKKKEKETEGERWKERDGFSPE